MLPDNMPSSPSQDTVKDEDVKMDDVEEPADKEEDGEETEDEVSQRKKRRRPQSDKQRKRELEQGKKEKEKEKAKEAAKAPPQSKQFIKLLKDIQKKEDFIKQCEEEIGVIENDLREADCPRTRVLGKDRFWNRYYWFERNGMPYAGLPDSSTADAGYANGCIWVQGPDDLERQGYIELSPEEQVDYQARFNMTVPERKEREEAGTSVTTARQWGFIGEPSAVEELIRWLDPRGLNEMRLRKELLNYRERITSHMEKRQGYLSRDREREREEETKRSSSRIRDKTPEPPSYRCLQWENTMALEELGRLHSDPPPPPPRARKGKKREAVEEVSRPMKTRRK